MTEDSRFAGSIPAIYHSCLVPVLFEPFARDLVTRAAALEPATILELAAGTGVVSHALAAALPASRIVSTDLNPAMLELAMKGASAGNLEFLPADAQSLPFTDGGFDLVLAQFGVMFFPDTVGAFREVRRVLKPGGTWLFNVWDSLEANSGSAAIHRAVRNAVPEPKPNFIARTPFGYHDRGTVEAHLREAGFREVEIDRVELTSPGDDAEMLARGMCLGSPLANELAAHAPEVAARALDAAVHAAQATAAANGLTMAALVVTARG